MGILNALRRNPTGQADAMRQTTSLTMAYLLEQNRKFEGYIRAKVEELEARVAAQQARTMTSIEETPPPVETAWTAPETVIEPMLAIEPGLAVFDDFWDDSEATEPVEAAVEPPLLDWQTALLGEAAPLEPAGSSLPAIFPGEGEAADTLSEAEPAELTTPDEPMAELNLSLADGPVEGWA